ncbi:GNAT family N-acetyltransferase [Flavobacterium algicola]|uniref:GNAT family N-acetyltransferase n=1 Tax=Flavobacterium algicola TaxID=556529 RepID=UPI001EFE0C51|nr:GNAT family N-acetyltransferase [Flavobacterium algicola]MCG9791440.1 N-acetyltransferase [Flavobacterium algicola]
MNPSITITDNNKGGTFKLIADEKTIGQMTFRYDSSSKIVIDHTEVDEDYNGKGFAKRLVERAIDFAKEKNSKIVPLCSFAKAYFDKHPELNDMVASS